MKQYNYIAKDLHNHYLKGSIYAENIDELREDLIKQELFLIKVKVKNTNEEVPKKIKINSKEIMRFFRKLAIMLKSGLNITESINTLIKGTPNKQLKKLLIVILQDLLKGQNLSLIMKKYPLTFTPMMIQMVMIAEKGGELDGALAYLATYLESENRVKEKVKSALIYPVILLVMTFIIILVLFIYIIPMYDEIFKSMGAKIPQLTKGLILISYFLRKNIILILLGVTLLIIGNIGFMKTSLGKVIKGYLGFKLPIIKTNVIWRFTSSITKSLTILIKSGLSVVVSLETVINLINNKYLFKKMQQVLVEVKSGQKISNSLMTIGIFPNMFIEMLDVGEESGEILEVLTINSQYYDEELSISLNRTIALIEPLMIIIIAIVIVIVMLAVFIPMFSMMDMIGGFNK